MSLLHASLIQRFASARAARHPLLVLGIAWAAASGSNAVAQTWDPETQHKPYESSRATTPIRETLAPPAVGAADYAAWADAYWHPGGSYTGGVTNPAKKYDEALRAARFFAVTGDGAWATAAVAAANAHRGHLEDPGNSDTVGFVIVAWAARTYTLLRDSAGTKPSGWEEDMHDWMKVVFEHLPVAERERGAMNRSIGAAVGADALYSLCSVASSCATQVVLDAKDYADAVWSDWYTVGGVAENSENYWALDMEFLIWWLELSPSRSATPSAPLDDPAMQALAEYTLEHFTSLGPMAQAGDTPGFAAGARRYIGILETWASAYGDGRYRWLAQSLYGFAVSREADMSVWNNMSNAVADSVLVAAYAAAREGASPTAAVQPEIGSSAITRNAWAWSPWEEQQEGGADFEMLSGTLSDKVVFRSGADEDQSFVAVGAGRSAPHGHADAGAVNTYVSRGSVVLASNAYLLKDAFFHNTFVVEPTPVSPPAPIRGAWKNAAQSPYQQAGGGRIEVTFSAKSISGSRTIGILRPFLSKGNTRTEIGDEWATHVVIHDYTGAGDTNRSILFAPLYAFQKSASSLVDAELLVDDVTVTWLDDPGGVTTNLPVTYDFTGDLDGWFPMDQFESGGECSPGAREPLDCAIEVSHEPNDGHAANGAMRLKFDVGYEVWRDTPDASATAFTGHDDFGYAVVDLPRHLGTAFDVERHLLFLGDLGLWARDEATAAGAFEGEIGPGWHFTAVAAEDAVDAWVDGAQTALALPWIKDAEQFLMHWSNRPRDLLIAFRSSSANAALVSEDVTTPPPLYDEGFDNLTSYARRVSFADSGSFTSGQTLRFDSLLRPHAPVADPEPLVAAIDWLVEDPDHTIVEIAGNDLGESTLAGFNESGGCVDVPGYDLSTDARAFRVVYGFNGIETWDLVDATALGEGECGTADATSLVDLASSEDVHERGGPQQASNGSFDAGLSGWTSMDGGGVATVTLTDTGGQLQVDTAASGGGTPLSHKTGARAAVGPLDPHEGVRIELDARSLVTGPIELSAQRTYGSSTRQSVPLDAAWQRYRITLDQSWSTNGIVFSAVAPGQTAVFATVADASFELDDVKIVRVPNVAPSPGFDGGTLTGWSALAQTTVATDDTDPVHPSSGHALRVTIPAPGGSPPSGWNSGARVTVERLPARTRVRASFDAKSVSGSSCIEFRRAFASVDGTELAITSSWKQYTVELDMPYEGPVLLFNVCDTANAAEFLLDNVVITHVPNRLVNGRFDDDVDGWQGLFDGATMDSLADPTSAGTHLYWRPEESGATRGPSLLLKTIAGASPPSGDTTGAVAALSDPDVLEGGSGTHVAFQARSLSGGTSLRIGLADDPLGPSATVTLSTSALEPHAVDLPGVQGDVLFSPIDANGDVVDAEIQLDDVVVTMAR